MVTQSEDKSGCRLGCAGRCLHDPYGDPPPCRSGADSHCGGSRWGDGSCSGAESDASAATSRGAPLRRCASPEALVRGVSTSSALCRPPSRRLSLFTWL